MNKCVELFPVFRRGLVNPCCPKGGRTRKVRVKLPNGNYLGEYHEGGYKVYQKLAFFVAFPIIAAVMLKCYLGHEEHERPPFVKYEYLRRRVKRFPWGDGNKSLFHNPHTNALPDGYETEDDD